VYRLGRDRYYAQRDADIERTLAKAWGQPMNPKSPLIQRLRDDLFTKYGGAWEFNEVVGMIRLHFVGTQIRGEWWRVDAKRVTRTRRKRFKWEHWNVVPEEEIPDGSSNDEIYGIIRNYLVEAQKELRPFHVNTEVFERLGPHVNWNAVLSASNSPLKS
jgi:hypothetical protein